MLTQRLVRTFCLLLTAVASVSTADDGSVAGIDAAVSERAGTADPISSVVVVARINDLSQLVWEGEELRAFAGDQVTGVIEIVNDTGLPIEINEVKPGCGCTGVESDRDIIASGAVGRLTLRVDRTDIGRKRIPIGISIDGRPYRVEFVSFVEPPMDLPAKLNFRHKAEFEVKFAKRTRATLQSVEASPAIVSARVFEQDENSARLRFQLLDGDHPANQVQLRFVFADAPAIGVPVDVFRVRKPTLLPSRIDLDRPQGHLFVTGDLNLDPDVTELQLTIGSVEHTIPCEIVRSGDRSVIRLMLEPLDIKVESGSAPAVIRVPILDDPGFYNFSVAVTAF